MGKYVSGLTSSKPQIIAVMRDKARVFRGFRGGLVLVCQELFEGAALPPTESLSVTPPVGGYVRVKESCVSHPRRERFSTQKLEG